MSTPNNISGYTLHRAIVREVGPLLSKVEIPEWVGTGALVSVSNEGSTPVVGTTVFVAANRMNDRVFFVSNLPAGGGGGQMTPVSIIYREPEVVSATEDITSTINSHVIPGIDFDWEMQAGDTVYIFGTFDVVPLSYDEGTLIVELWVNGVPYGNTAMYDGLDSDGDRATVSQNWTYPIATPGHYEFAFVASTVESNRGYGPSDSVYTILAPNTQMLVWSTALVGASFITTDIGPTGPSGQDGTNGTNGTNGTAGTSPPPAFSIPGVLTVGTSLVRWYLSGGGTFVNVVISVGDPPTGAALIIDVYKNGVTIFTGGVGRPTITSGSYVDLISIPIVTTFTPGDYLTIGVIQIGTTYPGSSLSVQINTA